MALTDTNSEDRLVQQTFADHLRDVLGWESVYAWNQETFGPAGTLGRSSEREVVLVRDLRTAVERLNPDVPVEARERAISALIAIDPSRTLLQHNSEFHTLVRDGIPVDWKDEAGAARHARVRAIDFRPGGVDNNRFLAVRELRIQGVRVPHYNRRADLICFVNGLPLVFIELKAVYRNIRAAHDDNLSDYLHEHSIAHAFHHNAFLVVSNGDRARYGSITSKWEHFVEWKRNEESDTARVDAEALLEGMLNRERLLDLVEHFILFDDSRAGGTRKVVARNHQVLGVNRAVESVARQEQIKRDIPREKRIVKYEPPPTPELRIAEGVTRPSRGTPREVVARPNDDLLLLEHAHPDLGKLGVFWHTQGSGKSYSMAYFVEKVRRTVQGAFTFLLITDREDLDDQIARTFIGCGVADEKAPRAASGRALQEILQQNHRIVFSLIHKFNQPVREPYSERDDIIVISDEAHRTQAGKFARNMRLALPNASFIGFTGTPIFRHDELTRRIFGRYVSRYDFKRSEEDRSTVRLVYESRGEKLGIEKLDLNDRMAEVIEQAELDDDQTAHLEKLLGRDYEVITADDRLDKLADDFVEHCSARWESGKSLLVCIDKVTCGRIYERIIPRWRAKLAHVRAEADRCEAKLGAAVDADEREELSEVLADLRGQGEWMDSTFIQIVVSESQNEVRDFARWGADIVPHRERMKTGFETPDGKRIAVEDAFKDPAHPFRIAIVCAMWLTGFDVECLGTLYVDKPMKAHNLMQAIARANRVYPGKEYGVIVDYNGLLKSLREALAQYALGDDEDGGEGTEIVAPLEELVGALDDAIQAAESHLLAHGFEVGRLHAATGFTRIAALRDAVDALCESDETRRRYELIARQVFSRFKALVMEPSAFAYAHRHDDIEAIYKKLQEKRDAADITGVLQALHRIVNDAIRTSQDAEGADPGLSVDLSTLDFERLRNEFAGRVKRKHAAVQDIRVLVEEKLAAMLAQNPARMDFYRRYQEIVADYNREKDRVTIEETFARLAQLVRELDAEQRRAVEEGLSEDELALFDLLQRESVTKAERERLKQASKALLEALRRTERDTADWRFNAATQADVRVRILDTLWTELPRPPYTDAETSVLSGRVYDFIWQRGLGGGGFVSV